MRTEGDRRRQKRERESRHRAECALGSGGNWEGLGWIVFGVGFVIQTNPKAYSPNMGFVTQYNTTQPNPLPQTPPNSNAIIMTIKI